MKMLLVVMMLMSSAFAQVNPDLPSPSVLTKKYLDLISKRQVGQSAFAFTWENEQYQQEGEERDIQESDVFKLGSKGEKELFLLNNYRGFQVISFKDGLERPKMIGRLPVYNNWSSEMYYLESQKQVLILNSEWDASFNNWGSNYNTVLYLVDVADTTRPRIIKEISVPGYLDSSRMVGDVLYTVSSDWGSEAKAQITSVKLSANSLEIVDTQALHGEKRWVRTMNVVKSGSRYYVISSQTGWRVGGDYINVYDITNPSGSIDKLFTAHARGQVVERNNTFIHRDHLFVASNWQQNEDSKSRISVEAFPMKAASAVITSKPNMRISVGDTSGQHASLQDVRMSGDYLYAFWVPANNIDPFELFDLSNPAAGIKHLGQLQFDGWISKAIPMDHNGRKFVLGLGWIIPTTSENNKRYPQAKIFEIKTTSSGVKHEVVTSLTLNSAEMWASLNDEDKTFEVVEEAPGVYNVMFPVTFRDGYKSGAKVVTANMNTLSLSEGASIIANQSWLRRVFVNREIRALNTFSDEELETYRQDDMGGRGVARVVSTLELARNIVDFHALSASEGVQIVRNDSNIEVRRVTMSDTDAEKTEILGRHSVKGQYEWHKIVGDRMFVITSFHKKVMRGEPDYQYESSEFEYANFNTMDLRSGAVSSERMDVTVPQGREDDEYNYFYFEVKSTTTGAMDILTIDQNIFKLEAGRLTKMTVPASCQYFFENKDNSFLELRAVGKEIYAFNAFEVTPSDIPEDEAGIYQLPFIKRLGFEGNTLECGASINVPGQPLMRDREFMVAREFQDMWEIVCYEYNPGESGEKGLYDGERTFSMRFKSERELELVDILDTDISAGMLTKSFVTYAEKESRLDVWRLGAEGEFISRPQYLNYQTRNANLITARNMGGREFIFMKNDKLVDVFQVAANGKLTQIPVTTRHDTNTSDGSAEYIFAIEEIDWAEDFSRFIISQGYYGVTDLMVK